ncbi:MAG TPA: penicillin-binding protein 1C [Kofleriaceae bacterium]|nr:penicillin-binding protein 1C [Kofleriaceae bacterium]
MTRTLRLRWVWRLARAAVWALTAVNALFLVGLVLALVLPLPERAAVPSSVVEYRDGRPAFVFLSPDDKWRLPVELDRLDPKLAQALVALEDKRFFGHDGVDGIAIARAALTNLTAGRRVSGGSTLTMQLARLLEPRPRTIRSKLVDMFRAVQLDLRLGKREILEAYLGRTPYGGNVEGVESAAWSYFGHGARHLTPLEIATLLAVPQGPTRYAPRHANLARLRARRDAILRKLVAAGVFTGVDAATALEEAAATPPPDRLRRMPREAPHAAFLLRARHPGELRIRSTLDAGTQVLVEREVVLRRPELRRKGIHGGSVVVVDHGTREVVALVGSLDFADAAHGGQIAMFARRRSPGSTLKPLLYALAIDRGLALPGYLVADIPMQYGTYRPHNFDGDYAGLVTLRDALSRSLNLPFVDLLQQFGVERFLTELGRMGVAIERPRAGEYGLSLIAGGIEMTPLELAGLYATLAGDGVYRPIRLDSSAAATPAPVPPAEARIFGPGAAWLTRETLGKKDRPDFPRRRDFSGLPVEIHWKTGTSFGLRDAWAIGSGPRYTAVVWTGNADNTPSAELVGSEASGPLLFDVLEGLADRTRVPAPRPPPAELVTVAVCAFSGYIASEACTARATALAPVHAVPTAPDPYHQLYEVDPATGRAVLPACRVPGRVYERRSFVVLPSGISAWLAERNRAVPEPPQFADGCAPETNTAAPTMLTPVEGQVVTLIPGLPAEEQRVPLAASSRTARVSWFVDGRHLGTAAASERLHWTPSPGRHEIVVTDEAGRKARRTLDVRLGSS